MLQGFPAGRINAGTHHHDEHLRMSPENGQIITTDTGSHLVLTSSPVLFTTQTEMREQLLTVTRSAEKTIALWSRDLRSGLFESPSFLDVLKRFVLARRNAKVRILTLPTMASADPRPALLQLADRLPNYFEIRTTDGSGLDAAELLVADERGALYRIHADRWDGMSDIYDPPVARFYRVQFDTAWNKAHSLQSSDQVVGA